MKKKNILTLLLMVVIFLVGAENSYATSAQVLGFFETPLLDRSPNRITNIKLAAQKISQISLQPGETFSFNEVVGKRTAEKGYKLGDVIVNGKILKGLGGGICQLSTTLYQAALSANLKVTEAHRHSLPVNYISPGKDATVSWGSLDFKFQNNSAVPVAITAEVRNNRVRVILQEVVEEKPIELYYNDMLLEMQPSAYLTKGITYVPLRSLSEHLGFLVSWNQQEEKITIEDNDNVLSLELYKTTALLNNETLDLSSPPYLRNEVTFVPLRFIAENFQLDISWSQEQNAVYITL
jgi:hypothetical protein